METFEKPTKTPLGDKVFDQDVKPLHEGSKGAAFTVENGVRVSINGKESSCLDEDGEGPEGLEDSEMNGVSSLLQMKESFRNIDVNSGSESIKGFGTLLGAVDKSKEEMVGGIEKVYPSGDYDDGKVAEVDGKERKELVHKECEISVGDKEGDDDGACDDLECEFSVGDFVWGKIKSHPWWPGQVYDPLDASDHAVKIRQKRKLLVAYFGDGSFAWCHPSQLKPFGENFEDLSKLSNSKNFLNAVQISVDEIGRLVELKMTCSCVPKEKCTGLDRPLATNAGIKEGVLVPEGGIEKLSIGVFEPGEILGKLKQFAEAASMSNLLECTVLKCWLSAFNRSIGRYEMPMYHEPMSVPDLEENARSLVVDMSNYTDVVGAPISGPVGEDWVSSSSGPKFGQHGQTFLRCPDFLEDGMDQSRKQKSIAEIIKMGLNVEGRKDDDVAQKDTYLGQRASSFRRKLTKGKIKANGNEGINSDSNPKKRKGTELSGSLTARKDKTSRVATDVTGTMAEMDKAYSLRGRKRKIKGASASNDDSWGKEVTNNSPVSGKRKRNVGLGIVNIDAETKDHTQNGSLLRERKKSKYLSPPYTSPTGKLSNLDIEAEPLKVADNTQLSEQMNQLPRGVHAEQEASNESSFHTPKQYHNKIDVAKVKPSANEVLVEVRSIAPSPQYRRENNSFESVVQFLSAFRCSVYREGSSYKMYSQSQSYRKRKSPNSVNQSSGENQNLMDHAPSGHRPQQKRARKKEETDMAQSKLNQTTNSLQTLMSEKSKGHNPEEKHATRAVVMKKNDKEVVENASTAALFVTFGPGSSLPTKDDLIRIYSPYGVLNTGETDMFYNNFSARIVFSKESDAEQAFNSSQNNNPFGASNVTFRLSTESANEQRKTPSAKLSPQAKETAKTSKKSSALQNSTGQASELNYIRNKLEMLTSMLEKPGEKMSKDIKSKLQSEIKGILDKVNAMVESSS